MLETMREDFILTARAKGTEIAHDEDLAPGLLLRQIERLQTSPVLAQCEHHGLDVGQVALQQRELQLVEANLEEDRLGAVLHDNGTVDRALQVFGCLAQDQLDDLAHEL